MVIKNELSPVLPLVIASLLNTEHDYIHLVPSHYSNFSTLLRKEGFEVAEYPVWKTPDDGKNYNTLLSLLPYGYEVDTEKHLQDFLSLGASRLVLLTPSNLLFSNRGKEKKFRHKLAKDNLIEASIQLPEKMLPDISIGMNILVLDTSRKSTESPDGVDYSINFIDASKKFSAKEIAILYKKGRASEATDLFRKIFDYNGTDCVKGDARDFVCDIEKSMLASSNCLTPRQKHAEALLKKEEKLYALKDLVNLFRPLLPLRDEEINSSSERIMVLPASQISPYGYTDPEFATPSEISVLRAGKMDPLIRENDVILCIRGAVGKVGIASPSFRNASPWIAHHSCIILRPSGKIPYDPRILFMFLRSELGQELLKNLNCGASVPLVQISDLKKLKIPLPSEEEASVLLKDFEDEQMICENIHQLEIDREKVVHRHWSFGDMDI